MPLLTIPTGNVASAIGGGYDVANSVRFNDDDSAYMYINPSSSGNPDKWTYSCWIKRTTLGAWQIFFSAGTDTNNRFEISFESDDKIRIFQKVSGSEQLALITTQLFRDVGAWYHFCLAVDSGQSVNTNKLKLYINGSQVTSFSTSTYFADDTNTLVSDASHNMFIGAGNGYTSNYFFDGYLAECVLINDAQLAPTEFGEFDEDSPTIWKPKDVSGLTFGTNGFYLDFEDSSNLGNDKSGGTDWTVSNLAATDQSTDTSTNNFCVINSIVDHYSDATLSEGNLKIVEDSGWSSEFGTFAVNKGKWYWEIKLTGTMSNHHHGIVDADNSSNVARLQNPQNQTGTLSFYNHDGGELKRDGSVTSADYGVYSSGDIMGIALNMDGGSHGQITFYKNNVALVSNYDLTANFDYVMPFASVDACTSEYNFGSPIYANSSDAADANGYGAFEYAPPSGYFALCTKNLAEYG